MTYGIKWNRDSIRNPRGSLTPFMGNNLFSFFFPSWINFSSFTEFFFFFFFLFFFCSWGFGGFVLGLNIQTTK